MHIPTPTPPPTHTHQHTYTCQHTSAPAHTHTHTPKPTHTHLHTCTPNPPTHSHTNTHAYTHPDKQHLIQTHHPLMYGFLSRVLSHHLFLPLPPAAQQHLAHAPFYPLQPAAVAASESLCCKMKIQNIYPSVEITGFQLKCLLVIVWEDEKFRQQVTYKIISSSFITTHKTIWGCAAVEW